MRHEVNRSEYRPLTTKRSDLSGKYDLNKLGAVSATPEGNVKTT